MSDIIVKGAQDTICKISISFGDEIVNQPKKGVGREYESEK